MTPPELQIDQDTPVDEDAREAAMRERGCLEYHRQRDNEITEGANDEMANRGCAGGETSGVYVKAR